MSLRRHIRYRRRIIVACAIAFSTVIPAISQDYEASGPTRGSSRRLTASCATSRTVQRARPLGGSLQTMAMMRWRCWFESKLAGSKASLPHRAAAGRTAHVRARPADSAARDYEPIAVSWAGLRRSAAHPFLLRAAAKPQRASPRAPARCRRREPSSALLDLSGKPSHAERHEAYLKYAKTFRSKHVYL